MALGPVKPHVKSAAESLASKFSIKTVYGWRPVDPFPDHPSGLAVDFMTSSKANGDALAAYAVQNAGALGIRYIIWYRQVWNAKQGWHPYKSSPNPHTDHVHITWNATAGSGNTTDVPVTNVDLPGTETAKSVIALYNLFQDINRGFKFVTDPGNIKRVALFGAGMVLVVIGVFQWDNVSNAVQSGVKAVGKVASNGSAQ